MKEAFKRIRDGYIHSVENHGFPIIVTICVAVITATALFTRRADSTYVSPPPPAIEHVSAAQLLQQSLANSATTTPAPTTAPIQWVTPLETIDVLRAYNADTLICYDSGVWALHDAVDLKASAGTQVRAIGDGEVITTGNDSLHGAWVTIRHHDGIEAHYAGMALLNDYIPGDAVRKGDTIGFCGNCMLDEASLGPHLHLRITMDGQTIDPCGLWQTGI